MTPVKIMLSAGEVSGDLQGAFLARELKRIAPQVTLLGMGGERMRLAGVDVKLDVTARGTIGLVEVFGHLPAILYVFSRMKHLLDIEKPQVLVLIDYQGFNMMLAKAAKARGIPTVYYIPPQEWLWGTQKGVKNVAHTIDHLLAIFEEEARIYREAGGRVSYIGHPVVDIARPTMDREAARKLFGLESEKVIGLFPGSRKQEIDKLLPILLEVAERLHGNIPKVEFLLALSSPIFRSKIEALVKEKNFPIKIVEGRSHDILNVSSLVIASSGTVTLESAYVGTPVIAFYKLSPLTYFIAKNILKVKLKFFSLPNIVANQRIIPELAQRDATPERITQEALSLINNPEKIKRMKEEFGLIREKLGSPGVIRRAAEAILATA